MHDTSGVKEGELRGGNLEVRIADVGRRLGTSLAAVLDSLPGVPRGPQKIASTLGVDKVLASRVVRAARNRNPIAVMQLAPGPDPIRRVLRAAKKSGTPESLIESASKAVDDLERLIHAEAGDRGTLGAMIASWLPDARAEFESRQKQAAFKTMSLLKGAAADVNLATVVLHPNEDGATIDVVWVMGLLGLIRLRLGTPLRFVSRRVGAESPPRRSTTIFGDPIEGTDSVLLHQFCHAPPATVSLHRAGDVNHYLIDGKDFGLKSRTDLIMAEASLGELRRYVPADSARKAYFFAEISIPARTLVFDVLVHRALFPGSEPSLLMYDTSFEGIANVNDRSRDVDRLDLMESIQRLGPDLSRAHVAELPRYAELLDLVFRTMRWERGEFRGFRCRCEYPIYGSQVTMAFDAATEPVGGGSGTS